MICPRRLAVITTGAAETCNGFYVPRSVFIVRTPASLIRFLTPIEAFEPFNRFESLQGCVKICKAIENMANTRKLTVAVAYEIHRRMFGMHMNRYRNPRTYWQFVELFYDKDFKGVFDLSGIVVKDDEFHFPAVDMEVALRMVDAELREMKIAELMPVVRNQLLNMDPPKKPFTTGYQFISGRR